MGPIVGALAAGLLYEFVFDQRRLLVGTQGEEPQLEAVEVKEIALSHNKNGTADVGHNNNNGTADVSHNNNGTADVRVRL